MTQREESPRRRILEMRLQRLRGRDQIVIRLDCHHEGSAELSHGFRLGDLIPCYQCAEERETPCAE